MWYNKNQGSYLKANWWPVSIFLKGPVFVSGLLERTAIFSASDTIEARFFEPARSFKRLFHYPVRSLLEKLGINPRAVKSRILHGKKGAGIKKTNKRVGLNN